jgi:exopolyphosphatase/guanosine-5'-triphosphate,3'-diphosphate pyrophosphatase
MNADTSGMRIAAIDVGTNSIHMVIADTRPGGFEVIDREREVVQIGRGSFAGGRLRAEAIQRSAQAFARFVQLARRHQVDRILCTATAAVREARNGGEFLSAARAAAGIGPRVIPAEEEGRLIYLAVKAALQLDDKPSLIVDIGGGSVQLVAANRERAIKTVSAPLGALRLTELMPTSDPPVPRDIARLQRHIRRTCREAFATLGEHRYARVFGSSGSIHALAHIAHALETGRPVSQINGHHLAIESLRKLTRRLQRMTTAEREHLPGMDVHRAEIIVPAAMVLLHILEETGLDGITISDFGVREGLVTDYVQRHAQEITAAEHIDDLRLRSAMQALDKFRANVPHAEHVQKLSLELFDRLQPLHGLGDEARDTLRFAALLHDLGAAVGYDRHADHSYYVIKHTNLRGFTADEVEQIANVARYHSKARPRKRDASFGDLSKPARRTVRWLSAILRIAEGLDRSHYQLVKALRVKRRPAGGIVIRVNARRDAQLELWAARRRADALARLIGGPVRIVTERGDERLRPEASRNGGDPGRKGRKARITPAARAIAKTRSRANSRPSGAKSLRSSPARRASRTSRS